jgi:hypothetical protein
MVWYPIDFCYRMGVTGEAQSELRARETERPRVVVAVTHEARGDGHRFPYCGVPSHGR